MAGYIYERPEWPNFTFDAEALLSLLANAAARRGQLIGLVEGLGFRDLQETKIESIRQEIVQSSSIEGENLDSEQVRSSVARRLGLEEGGLPASDQRVEGAAEMAIDASENATEPLTKERLFRWHAGLFPEGRGPYGKVPTGKWRDDAEGPMQVVSGRHGKEKVHFQAPAADRIDSEINLFLHWLECETALDGTLKAGIAHLWFVTIHPFEDGNGRVGRAILDMMLARADKQKWRCYSVSSQIREDRKQYYDILEKSQKGGLDVSPWLEWYLGCLDRSLLRAAKTIEDAVARTRFWRDHADRPFNERQRKMLSRMLMGWEGKMTPSKWSRACNVTTKTAQRDLVDLVAWGVLVRDDAGGRSTGYLLPSR